MIDISLKKKPEVKTLIEGFPGFGLVGTIVTEFLIEHLACEQIGEFVYDQLPATAAIHKGKLVHPMGIYYNKKYKLLILHTILDVKDFEWEISAAIQKLVKQTKPQEILSIEGVAGTSEKETLFCFNSKKLEKAGARAINESVIMGVTASLLLKLPKLSCIFAQTKSHMPDSRAAAKVIELLDKHLGFNLDTKPLLMQAELFENKLKKILQQANQTREESQEKQMSYLG